MKKTVLLVILSILVLAFLTSCKAKPYSFKETVEDIESVEIVDVDVNMKFTVLKTLSEAEKTDFLEKFQTINFKNDNIGDPPKIYGKCVKITYQNGSYEIISFNINKYVNNDKNKSYRKRCDEKVFVDLLDSFLKEETNK